MVSLGDAAKPAVYYHPRSAAWIKLKAAMRLAKGHIHSQKDALDTITNDTATLNGHTNGIQHVSAQQEGNQTLREEYVDCVWDEFVTHFLLGSQHIQQAAIFDLETRRPLASRGLSVANEELEQIVQSLHYHELAYRNGVTIGGKCYKVRLADGRNGILARTEREGCTVCKTQTLLIIGVHDENGNSRRCNEEVMRLGDFFRRKAL